MCKLHLFCSPRAMRRVKKPLRKYTQLYHYDFTHETWAGAEQDDTCLWNLI